MSTPTLAPVAIAPTAAAPGGSVTVTTTALSNALAVAAKFISARPVAPVLAGVLIQPDAANTGITLTATDFETFATLDVPATGTAQYRGLVPARLLADILKKLATRKIEQVTLTNVGEFTTVGYGTDDAAFTIRQLAIEDYPAIPAGNVPTQITLPVSDLLHLGRTLVAAGRDDTLPALTGIHLASEGSTLTAACTDRYRLCVAKAELVDGELVAPALVPARAFATIIKALSPKAQAATTVAGVTVLRTDGDHPHPTHVVFRVPGMTLTTRVIDGEFPKVKSLIPDSVDVEVLISNKATADAVSTVALVAERNTPVRAAVEATGVRWTAGTGEDANASELVACDTPEGVDMATAFNPNYLLDGLKAVGGEAVTMGGTASGKPWVFTDPSATEPFLYLLMPVRIGG